MLLSSFTDFRALNKVTHKFSYPVLRTEEVLNEMGKAH